jgi:hypothetical protein
MEELPNRSPNEEPHGHEGERLDPGEIDLTGVVRQDDSLRDVIGDAIVEAEAGNGQFPEWGARTLARALANRLENPFDGALHHYAITGHLNPDHIAHELAIIALRTDADDDETLEWINWLGTYALSAPTGSGPGEDATGKDDSTAPDLRSSPEAFGRHLRQVFAEADARGEPIAQADARSLAMLFSIFLDSDSEMARFADTGDANPVLLHHEAQFVRRLTEHTPGAADWIDRFEQHLASRADLGRQQPAEPHDVDRHQAPLPTAKPNEDHVEPDTAATFGLPDTPQIRQGLLKHGDAFRAYLQLPDIDPDHEDILQGFDDFYIGTYGSLDALVTDLGEDIFSSAELEQLAREGVTREDMAHASWDIVEIGGRLYVFTK